MHPIEWFVCQMATPTLSLATMGSSRKKPSKSSDNNTNNHQKSSSGGDKTSVDSNGIDSSRQKANSDKKKLRKFWGEEQNEDSVYSIYLKKITYSVICEDIYGLKLNDRTKDSECSDQTDTISASNKKTPKRTTTWFDDQQCLQWETRQIRIIRAATLDHIVKYILFLTPNHCSDEEMANQNILEEERNNVAHAMHVMFCTYRQYHTSQQLLAIILRYQHNCCQKQLNFILHYWLDNYSDDFRAEFTVGDESTANVCKDKDNSGLDVVDSSANSDGYRRSPLPADASLISNSYDSTSSSNYESNCSTTSSDSSRQHKPMILVDKLLSVPNIDGKIYRKCLNIVDTKSSEPTPDIMSTNQKSYNKSSSVLELDPRFIAQQITAIDLENFLYLKPHSLLFTTSKSKSKIQNMIKNFNLLSRHVIITILKAHSPHVVTSHWIEVALQLRKIRNFNSLKAIIAGLTNESIYRLKQSVWTKISRASMSTFKWLSTIVDDVNNQTLLRHTQLIIEGTSKVSLEDESFGTIPYLGTFLTDITMINTRYPSFIQSQSDVKLINFEKCSQQYEILMQIQLLQKSVVAALTAIQQQTQQLGRSYLPLKNTPFTPTIPRVARIFRIWFQANDIELITDKQCYELSLELEGSPAKPK